jgi:hypothetical protein
MGQTNFTTAEWNEIGRKTQTPSILSSYLPVASPYTTPTLVGGTPTKVLIPTTVKEVRDFELDVPNTRWTLTTPNVVDRNLSIVMTTTLTSSSSNHDTVLMMYKNGALESGISIDRKIGTGSDKGAYAISGTFKMSTGDYIEVYVEDSSGGTLTFLRTSIKIIEIN